MMDNSLQSARRSGQIWHCLLGMALWIGIEWVLQPDQGRFIGPIRPLMPLVAGAMNMPAGLFVPVNLASALLWAPVYILPGYMAGRALDYNPAWQNFAVGGLLFLALAGAAMAAMMVRRLVM